MDELASLVKRCQSNERNPGDIPHCREAARAKKIAERTMSICDQSRESND